MQESSRSALIAMSFPRVIMAQTYESCTFEINSRRSFLVLLRHPRQELSPNQKISR